ncbi:MAG TPA: aldo/keto reductase [Acetobacteraceae bacterium]|nr:aldo/keto reductase [Acetobacteraceae bacterium]
MEHRQLGRSGLKVPVLSLGTAGFGGRGEFFRHLGEPDVATAARMVDLCLNSGVNFFDTAEVYSQGLSEEILGQVIKRRRDQVLISTKATFSMGDDPNGKGSSRFHIMRACEASLKRLRTDHIDIYFLHDLFHARVRCAHPDRGGPARARRSREEWQDRLYRRLEFLWLAPHESARDLGEA